VGQSPAPEGKEFPLYIRTYWPTEAIANGS
jgi:hypothetical protein